MSALQPMQFSPLMMPKTRPAPQAEPSEPSGEFSMRTHAMKQADLKGFAHKDVLQAANDPQTTYPNGRYPGQMRHIRNNIVAVVDPSKGHVVTVYENIKETALRPDQTDADAQRYAKNNIDAGLNYARSRYGKGK